MIIAEGSKPLFFNNPYQQFKFPRMIEKVILVDEQDRQIGTMEKLQAHLEAKLHRAFSVFIFNGCGQLMLQQRAFSKYHSPGLWTNTCCSHPRPGETVSMAAHRRLQEEMGFECSFDYAFNFIYKASFDNNLTEHELDHVFIGTSNQLPYINPDEVASYKFMSMDEIKKDIQLNPDKYTVWFKIAFDQVENYYLQQVKK